MISSRRSGTGREPISLDDEPDVVRCFFPEWIRRRALEAESREPRTGGGRRLEEQAECVIGRRLERGGLRASVFGVTGRMKDCNGTSERWTGGTTHVRDDGISVFVEMTVFEGCECPMLAEIIWRSMEYRSEEDGTLKCSELAII